MKIENLTDKQKDVNLELKVIYDKMKEKQYKGQTWKTLVVVDADSEQGGQSALLDVTGKDLDLKFQDKLKTINCFAKKIKTSRGEQFLITYGFKDGNLIGKYGKIE